MGIFKKHSLRAGNSRTRAAELTLRESIYPLCLVTVLFFLWVRTCFLSRQLIIFASQVINTYHRVSHTDYWILSTSTSR